MLLLIALAAPVRAAERQATPPSAIRVQPGFKVELLRSAGENEGSWISMSFDDAGRILLAEDKKGILRWTPSATSPAGELEVLKGTDILAHCRGILYAHNSLYVCATNGKGLYRLRDLDGDGQFEDVKLLCEMEYKSRYGHGANQMTVGPDGMIYIAIGNDVVLPKVCDPNSPYRNPQNDWLLPNPADGDQDERVGIILKTDPEGKTWTVVAGGLRNQVDVAFNSDGELFTWDADMEWDLGLPWYRPTRINHVVSGGEYGWRWGTGKWPAWYPDSLPTTVDTGLSSPTGLLFGTKSNWPEKYRQMLYAADWQNGRLLMVDLVPNGATYQGKYETLLDGSPLNICDMVFGRDGAMYFITGGRGSQSGLYRVSYVGTPDGAAAQPATNASAETIKAAAKARKLRKDLEELHVVKAPQRLDFIWKSLGSDDPWLRFAARTALENQPVDSWRERVASSQDSRARHTALLALARMGEASDQQIVLRGLADWDWNTASEEELIFGLRTLQLTLIRQGMAQEDADRLRLLAKVQQLPKTESFPVNWLRAELLVALQSPTAIDDVLALLDQGATQEEQIQYVKTLTRIENGWTLAQRKRVLNWLAGNRKLPGGKLVSTTLGSLKDSVVSKLSDEEKQKLSEELQKVNAPVSEEQELVIPVRPLVQRWKMEDLDNDVAALNPESRSIENGRRIVREALCLRCHLMGDRGGQLGPNLTSVGKRYDGRALLESILHPSKEIDPKYQNAMYLLDDGRVVSGRTIAVSRDRIGVEIDPLTGASVNVPRMEIVESKPSDISPMPAGLLDSFTKEEILDLIAYLRSPDRN